MINKTAVRSTSVNRQPITPSTFPAIAMRFPVSRLPLWRISTIALRPSQMAGKPLKHARKKRAPSATLAIALPLVTVSWGLKGSHSSPSSRESLGTPSSHPQSGQRTRWPTFVSAVLN
jgi:hypothetical protein